jgi:hypothetical protein
MLGDGTGLVMDVFPGEAEQRPTKQLQSVLSAHVRSPSLSTGVPSVTIGLDSQEMRRISKVQPGHVLIALANGVLGDWEGEAVLPDQAQKGGLERALQSRVSIVSETQ